MSAYAVRRPPRHESVRLRGLTVHLTRWGPAPTESAPPIVLLHGWQDTSDTFQFMVDAFRRDWPLVAPDWRGFGRSEWPQEGYWFPDYLADLDALLDQLSPDAPLSLVGHSMGGNVASLYAGLRPHRVRRVANLEGFGLPRGRAADAPAQMRRWLDQVRAVPVAKEYESLDQLTDVIQYRYPRFSAEQAAFVAAAWSENSGGRVRLSGDQRHRWINPLRYHREDAEAIWREATAPTLMVLANESEYLQKLGPDGRDDELLRLIPQMRIVRVADAGHMLHIEKAAEVAALIEEFFESP